MWKQVVLFTIKLLQIWEAFPVCTTNRAEANYGAATVLLRPACPGSGVTAGGAVRVVLEMAGVENALGKQLRSKNLLNNARATVKATQMMRQFSEVAAERGLPMEELWKWSNKIRLHAAAWRDSFLSSSAVFVEFVFSCIYLLGQSFLKFSSPIYSGIRRKLSWSTNICSLLVSVHHWSKSTKMSSLVVKIVSWVKCVIAR